MSIVITHKFRLYLSEEQEGKLLFILEQCRWLYNKLHYKEQEDTSKTQDAIHASEAKERAA